MLTRDMNIHFFDKTQNEYKKLLHHRNEHVNGVSCENCAQRVFCIEKKGTQSMITRNPITRPPRTSLDLPMYGIP